MTPHASHSHHHSHLHTHDAYHGEAGVLMRRATTFSLIAAGLLILIKTVTWWYTDSLSLLSSLFDSMLDILTSFINFLAVRYALQPPDKEHRFGHGKAEEIAGLAQATFIAGSGLFIGIEAIRRLFLPEEVSHETAGIAVMVVSMAITAALVLYQRYVIRKTGSTIVTSDSLHYLTDVLTNGGVILALILAGFLGWEWADPLIALAIAGYILFGAWQIGHKSFHNLMDREFDDAERLRVVEIIRSHPEIKGYHRLKTRRAGIHGFIQFHLDLDESLTLKEAHAIADRIEKALEEAFPHTEIIIHEDPAPQGFNRQ